MLCVTSLNVALPHPSGDRAMTQYGRKSHCGHRHLTRCRPASSMWCLRFMVAFRVPEGDTELPGCPCGPRTQLKLLTWRRAQFAAPRSMVEVLCREQVLSPRENRRVCADLNVMRPALPRPARAGLRPRARSVDARRRRRHQLRSGPRLPGTCPPRRRLRRRFRGYFRR